MLKLCVGKFWFFARILEQAFTENDDPLKHFFFPAKSTQSAFEKQKLEVLLKKRIIDS